MLTDLVKKESVLVDGPAANWEEAVEKAARPLVEDGSIEPRYVDGMIRTVKELGPYIVIAPGIAIAHARPEEGANKTALGLAILRDPVPFGNKANDPVRLVITLAAPSNAQHVKALGRMVELLSDPSCSDGILNAKSVDEVYSYLSA